MKKFRKIAALLLAVAMVFAFAACGKDPAENEGTTAAPNADATGDVYHVGIVQLVQHEALDAATKGFRDALTKKLGNKVVFDEQNASGESTNCTTIVSKFVADKVDLIMANATPALAAAMAATQDIPIVGTSITDYATALSIDDWTGKTGMNITGTADLAPLADQAAIVKELCPDAKTVGILYCSAEPNSKYQSDIVVAELEKLGYETKVYTFVDTNDVSAVTQEAAAAVDAVYIPTDNTAANNAEAINNILEPAGIPVVAGEQGICKGCGVATLSIDYYSIGYAAGEMAFDVLVNGADPAEMEIGYSSTFTKMYVKDRADALKIAVPDSYQAIEVEAE